jgi:hypothetical protein
VIYKKLDLLGSKKYQTRTTAFATTSLAATLTHLLYTIFTSSYQKLSYSRTSLHLQQCSTLKSSQPSPSWHSLAWHQQIIAIALARKPINPPWTRSGRTSRSRAYVPRSLVITLARRNAIRASRSAAGSTTSRSDTKATGTAISL